MDGPSVKMLFLLYQNQVGDGSFFTDNAATSTKRWIMFFRNIIPIIRPDTYLIFATLYSPETTLWYLLNININVKKTEKKILTKGGLLIIFLSSIFFLT